MVDYCFQIYSFCIVSDSFFSRLFALKKVLDEGLITDIDYEAKKKSILNDNDYSLPNSRINFENLIEKL